MGVEERGARDRLAVAAAELRAIEAREDREVLHAIYWVTAIGAVVIFALWVWL